MLPLQGTWVQSLVRELRSHRLYGAAAGRRGGRKSNHAVSFLYFLIRVSEKLKLYAICPQPPVLLLAYILLEINSLLPLRANSRTDTELKFLCYCCWLVTWVMSDCDPMSCSMPGFPVLYHHPKLAQTHVPWVSDAIHSSHPLLPPSPLALNLSQHLHRWRNKCSGFPGPW